MNIGHYTLNIEQKTETNPNTKTTPPRYITSLSRKCKDKKGINEELLLEDSVYLTPPPVTPQKQNPQNKPFELIPNALEKFRKRKEVEPLLSPKPKKSKKSSSTKNSHDCHICKKVFSKKYNVERHIEKNH